MGALQGELGRCGAWLKEPGDGEVVEGGADGSSTLVEMASPAYGCLALRVS